MQTSLEKDLRSIKSQLDKMLITIGQPSNDPDNDVASPHAVISDANAVQASARQRSGSLPHPRLIRRILDARRLRARFFKADLFADPAWDMLLDLAAAESEFKRISVTSLCLASGVPPTTALRWIGALADAGLVERLPDRTDGRRAFITLTDAGLTAIAIYFAALGPFSENVV